MLRARRFDNFKGAPTLLIWGDAAGLSVLSDEIDALLLNPGKVALVGEREASVEVRLVDLHRRHCVLRASGPVLRLECSPDVLAGAEDLIAPLLTRSGHQYLEVSGDAEQIIISCGEYPADLN